jgi:hypothetical protein
MTLTLLKWLSGGRRAAPIATSYSVTVLSGNADASCLPSDENVTA